MRKCQLWIQLYIKTEHWFIFLKSLYYPILMHKLLESFLYLYLINTSTCPHPLPPSWTKPHWGWSASICWTSRTHSTCGRPSRLSKSSIPIRIPITKSSLTPEWKSVSVGNSIFCPNICSCPDESPCISRVSFLSRMFSSCMVSIGCRTRTWTSSSTVNLFLNPRSSKLIKQQIFQTQMKFLR